MFSFWASIFAKKQALLGNCELMPTYKSNCQHVQAVHSYQELINLATDNVNEPGISKYGTNSRQ